MSETPFLFAFAGFAALLLGIFMLILRQLAQASINQEQQRQMQAQLEQSTRLMAEMGRELGQVRNEAIQQAETHRARTAVQQTEHLTILQTQVKDIVTMTHQQLETVRGAMQERLADLSGNVTTQLGQHGKVIMEVKGQLGGLAEAAKHMQLLGQDISSLQDILQAPKLRGNLGELFLEEILRQVLPAHAYEMQSRLPIDKSGGYVTVDAVIRLGDRTVPVDSKFPLESFRRLLASGEDERVIQRRAFLNVVRNHIDVVAEKYIRPDAGTYDFALAYLPAENIYYEAIVRHNDTDGPLSLASYAAQRKVIVVSPNTMYAYLLTVAYGLRGMHIEKQAEAIRDKLTAFNKKFTKFYLTFEKVGRDLGRAQLGYDDALKRATKLSEQVTQITGTAEDLEALENASLASASLSPTEPPIAGPA